MNRIIKFRGKPLEDVDFDNIGVHISKDDFVYGNLIVDGNQAWIVKGVIESTNDYITLEQWIPVDCVGQYTGLKDKHGKEIYEGDVIKELGLKETWTLSRRDEFSERKHVIKWCDYDLQWCGVLIEDDGDYELDTRNLSFLHRKYTLEVIGNIHDKEEL